MSAGEAFQPNHFVPLLFYTQQKRKSAAATQVSKKQKLTPILSKKVSKKPDTNISSFFIKPTVDPTSHKAPNETLPLAYIDAGRGLYSWIAGIFADFR